MLTKGVTLRGLEVFEALSRTGSVAGAAELTGLSQPSVSQQLRNLEAALGTALVDHGRRPMRLTAAGQSFLRRAETALSELRLGQSELTRMDLSHLDSLSIGLIDDFDNDLTPRLATDLAASLAGCRFEMITASSHEIVAAMRNRRFHVAVAASAEAEIAGVTEYPLAQDPFVVVAPRGALRDAGELFAPAPPLPFLRYAREQLIAEQIARLLQRHDLALEDRFEIGSHLALMAMVAQRIGWAITTPLGYMRATRFHDDLDVFALPFDGAARRISLFAASDWVDTVPLDIARTMQRLMQSQMISPAIERLPWLAEDLVLIDL
jgi:DNA-binding transcriptional LysR family regulator